MDKLDLIVIQTSKGLQILVPALIREGVDAFIAVVKMCKKDIGTCILWLAVGRIMTTQTLNEGD